MGTGDRDKKRARRSLLDRIADAVGDDLALSLAIEFGGTQLYIPHTMTKDSDVVRVVGYTAAAKLAKAFGGTAVFVPIGPRRRAKIRELLQQKKPRLTVRQVAETVETTERHVYAVLRELRAEQPVREDVAESSDVRPPPPSTKGKPRQKRKRSKVTIPPRAPQLGLFDSENRD